MAPLHPAPFSLPPARADSFDRPDFPSLARFLVFATKNSQNLNFRFQVKLLHRFPRWSPSIRGSAATGMIRPRESEGSRACFGAGVWRRVRRALVSVKRRRRSSCHPRASGDPGEPCFSIRSAVGSSRSVVLDSRLRGNDKVARSAPARRRIRRRGKGAADRRVGRGVRNRGRPARTRRSSGTS